MNYVSIDGDDVGRRITALYLSNDHVGLGRYADTVKAKVDMVSDLLMSWGFTVIFAAADGVVGYSATAIPDVRNLYEAIRKIGDPDMTFSVGVGETLREAYVALLAAKSQGKANLCLYGDIGRDVPSS